MSRAGQLSPAIFCLMGTLLGCATLRTNNSAPCEWIEIATQPGLIASGQRSLNQGHVRPHECGKADLFTLDRQRYVLEMWNGGAASPLLYLRVSTADGKALRLDSSEIEPTIVGGLTTHYERGMQYQYVFRGHTLFEGRPRPIVFPHSLVLGIVDDRGQVVGKESLTLIKASGRFYFNEF